MHGISKLGLLLILLSAALTAAANLLLRRGVLSSDMITAPSARAWLDLLREPAFLLGGALYGLAAVVWFRVLAIEQITTSYPILIGLTFVLVSSGAVLVFRESISATKLVGMCVILAGVALVSRG